ncbi:MAG: hypothetical protein ACX94C_10730 [Phycisphaerales bacterium]
MTNTVYRLNTRFVDDGDNSDEYLLPPKEDLQVRYKKFTVGNASWVAPELHIRQHPQYVGVVVNTMTSTLVLYLAFLIPLCIRDVIRKQRRRESRRCVHCAYDITGLRTCPECGTPCEHGIVQTEHAAP